MAIWVKWKRPVKSIIVLDTQNVDSAQDDNTSSKYINLEISFSTALWMSVLKMSVLNSCLCFLIPRKKMEVHRMLEIEFTIN